jgi:hypothetical protein
MSQERALLYLNSIADQIASLDDSFQLIVLELIRKVLFLPSSSLTLCHQITLPLPFFFTGL